MITIFLNDKINVQNRSSKSILNFVWLMAKFCLFITLIISHWHKVILDDIYKCAYYSELFVGPSGCKDYICWESQLTDLNRETLTIILNNYRSNVAQGIHPVCSGSYYQPMFKLIYHWQIEDKCIQWLKRIQCALPLPVYTTPGPLPDHIEAYSGSLEPFFKKDAPNSWIGGINTIKLEYNDYQDDVIQRIDEILLDVNQTKRFMHSWKEDGQYRYGSHAYYGCALLIANNMTGETDFGGMATNDRVAYVACIFLAFMNNSVDKVEATPRNGLSLNGCNAFRIFRQRYYPIFNENTGLCEYGEFGDFHLNRPCQIYYYTDKLDMENQCPGEVPLYWSKYIRPRPDIKTIRVVGRRKVDTKDDYETSDLEDPFITIKTPITTTRPTTRITTPSITSMSTLTNPYPYDNLSDSYCNNMSLFCIPPLLIFFILCLISIILLYILFKVYSVRFRR